MNMKNMMLASAVAIAAVAPQMASANTFTGPYLGLNLGYSKSHYEGSIKDTDLKWKMNPSGVMFGLHGGYGYDFDTMYLGLDLNADWGSGNAKGEQKTSNTKKLEIGMKRSAKYGAALHLGKVFDGDFLPYVKVGVSAVKADADLKAIRTTTGKVIASAKASKTAPALDLGLGLRYAVTKNVHVGGEYTYSHSSFSIDKSKDGESFGEPFDFKANSHEIKARVSYQF